MLSAGFSIGRNNAKEAALAACSKDNWESFANRPRRETAVGLPTLTGEGIADIIRKKAKGGETAWKHANRNTGKSC